MRTQIQVNSLQETEILATKLAPYLSPPDVITLEGDLGAGKTTFTQALARGLGIERTVSSPTFTILKQYEGRYPFNHLDVYRLANSEEDLGWDELLYGDAISVVEWARYIQEELPTERLELQIAHAGGDSRLITFIPHGDRFTKICKELNL